QCSWAVSFLSDLFALLNSYYCFWGLPESSRDLQACSRDFLRVLLDLLYCPLGSDDVLLERGLQCLASLSGSTNSDRLEECSALCQGLLSQYSGVLDRTIEGSQHTGEIYKEE
ncbi:hypothetical protein GDO81_019374, partial [Engystomops pustulosus]